MRNYCGKQDVRIFDNTRDYARRERLKHEDVVEFVELSVACAKKQMQNYPEDDDFYQYLKGICACEEKCNEQGKYYTISNTLAIPLAFRFRDVKRDPDYLLTMLIYLFSYKMQSKDPVAWEEALKVFRQEHEANLAKANGKANGKQKPKRPKRNLTKYLNRKTKLVSAS